jgi:hypothetical protein
LREFLLPALRPAGFSHGVPAELLEKSGPGESRVLFVQRFPAWQGDRTLSSVFIPAGADVSGRVVHLGLIFVLPSGERPRFDMPYSGLSDEDRPYAAALLRRMTTDDGSDVWARSARELLDGPDPPGPATNVELERSVVRFSSRYALGADGLMPRFDWLAGARMAGIGFLVAVVVMAVVLGLRAAGCRAGFHSVAEPRSRGGVTWRSS